MAINRLIAHRRAALVFRVWQVWKLQPWPRSLRDKGSGRHVVLGGSRAVLCERYPVRAHSKLPLGWGGQALVPWLLYSTGVVAGLAAYSRFACSWTGLGEVGWDRACRTLASVVGMFLFWGALRASLGLVGISAALLVQNLMMFYGAGALLSRFSVEAKSSVATPDPAVRQLLSETGKLASLGLIGYLVMNSGAFIVERKFEGAESRSSTCP